MQKESMTQTQPSAQRANYKWWVFGAIAVGLFVSVMDQSGLTIAIPQMADSFHAGIPTVQWVVLGYVLTISALMLPMGRIGDIIGRKRVYLIGFLVFAASGVMAGLSPNLGAVIAFKCLQGVGSAMTQATSMAIVTSTFPAQERGKAIGLITTMVGIGAVAGPVVGGVLVQALGWRAIFLIGAPLGALAAFAGLVVLSVDKGQSQGMAGGLRSFDYLGAALSTAALIAFLLIMSFGYRAGWTSLVVLGGAVAVVILLAVFLAWERRASQPLIPLALFQRATFSLGTGANLLSFMAGTAMFFLMPFYLQQVLGYSPGQSGMILVAPAICFVILGPLAGRLSDRFGTRPFTMLGAALSTVAFLLFSRLTESSPLAFVVLGLFLGGAGMAIFQSPNTSAVLGAVERERYGVATAFLNLVRNSGNMTGLALATTIVTATMAAQGFAPSLSAVSEAGSEGVKSAFALGLTRAFLLSSVFSAAALILSAFQPKDISQKSR